MDQFNQVKIKKRFSNSLQLRKLNENIWKEISMYEMDKLMKRIAKFRGLKDNASWDDMTKHHMGL